MFSISQTYTGRVWSGIINIDIEQRYILVASYDNKSLSPYPSTELYSSFAQSVEKSWFSRMPKRAMLCYSVK